MSITTILIADDHPIFRKGLVDILQTSIPGCRIYEAANGKQAIEILLQNKIDIAILDIDMPQVDGFGVCKSIKENYLPTKVIFLTMYKESTIFHTAMELGASGFLLKDNTAEEIIDCLFKVQRGYRYISQYLGDYTNQYQEYTQKKRKIKSLIDELTQTERRTLKLVSENYSTKEIADILFVTPKSVENYRSRICKKLGLELGNNALVKWALENKELLRQIEW
ncbi:MAG: response regulator transcription factor [Bacteroidia bacterium]|nr:response regulator transcription factor [Bacteroidia bacterium]MDW8301156.1 response regulator transcription factor [Bacteroidia bacterium]